MPETHYYKILDAAPPQPLPESLPSTPLDAKDGFIHLSTAAQTSITADLYFQDHQTLWILRMRVDKLGGRVQIDDDNRGCPHLYDSKTGLGQSNVAEVIEAKKDGHAKWSDVPALKSLPS